MKELAIIYVMFAIPLFIYTFLCGFLAVGASGISLVGLIMITVPVVVFGLTKGFAWIWTRFHRTEAPAA